MGAKNNSSLGKEKCLAALHLILNLERERILNSNKSILNHPGNSIFKERTFL